MGRVSPLEISGVRLVSIKRIEDDRGEFIKIFDPIDDASQDKNIFFSSISISRNYNVGTLRGLHFQTPPYSEHKLISCIKGSVFDVFVDLRPNSKTIGNWASFELSETSASSLYLPPGIAHGYQTRALDSTLIYGISPGYVESSTRTLNFADPTLAIEWPLSVEILSDKDKLGISLSESLELFSRD